MPDPEFLPISDDHAIQAVTFALIVDKPFQPATISAVQQNHRKWRDELPAVQTPQGFEVEVSPGGLIQKPIANSVVFSYLRPDGTPAWVFQFTGTEIAVECTRYTRFERIWASAAKYLKAGLAIVQTQEPDRTVPTVSLQVVDKFRATAELYNLKHLFKSNKYLAEAVFDVSPVWHNHVGWFEPLAGNNSLQRINLDARREGPDEVAVMSRPVFISITHYQQIRYKTPMSIRDYCADSCLDVGVRAMHDTNKAVMTELLTDEIAARIGLLEKSR